MKMIDRRESSNPTTPASDAEIAMTARSLRMDLDTRRIGNGGGPSDCETSARITPRMAPTAIVAVMPQQIPRTVGEVV